MTKYVLLAFSAIVLYTSCSKKPTAAGPDRESMLRTGKWKVTAGTFTRRLPIGSVDTTLNYMNFIPECHKDDYIMFDSMMHAATYSGSVKCNASDADHIPFVWQLKNNGNNIDLYNGYNNLYTALIGVLPVTFDTTYNDGTLVVVDTLVGALDTPAHGHYIVLDSIWKYKVYDTITTAQTSIYNAEITDFSQSSFKLHFNVISTYPNVRNGRWSYPLISPDTIKYVVTYTNF